MADETTPTDGYRPRCTNLCCKSMLVFGEAFEQDPEYQDGTIDFWCTRTSTCMGPDGEEVTLGACSDAKRGCFKEY